MQLLLCHTIDKCHLIGYKPCFIHLVNINYLMNRIACKFRIANFRHIHKKTKNSPPQGLPAIGVYYA